MTQSAHGDLFPGVIQAERRISRGQVWCATVSLHTSLPAQQWHNALMGPDLHEHTPRDFEALTRHHKDSVYRQMIRACGNREDAEDVLVEALLKAYRHLDQLHDSAAFRAWLTQIAKRVCWQLKEKEALLPLMQLSALYEEGREIASSEPTPEVQLVRRQMAEFLSQAVAALPPLYRQVYRLRDIEDRSGDEVAHELGISRAAMKSRLHRARELVRAHLDAALTQAGST